MKTCYNCAKKTNITLTLEGDIYCIPCHDELSTKCSECQSTILLEEAKLNPDDNSICESCFDSECANCDTCDHLNWQSQLQEFRGVWYCDNCIWEICSSCSFCNELDYSDNFNWCETCEQDICGDCSCDCNSNFQDQILKFENGKKSKLITVDRFVGIEIEAENGDSSEISLPDTFGIKSDGSLDSSGVEIVTPPSKNGALIKNIKLACEQLNGANFDSTNACGLHVHIDLRDIATNYVKLSRILRTFYAIEDIIFAMLPDSRLHSSYCEPLRNHYYFYDFYGQKVASKFDCTIYNETDKTRVNGYKRQHGHSKRYSSFNFHSTFYRGTLEIRAHSASQNPTKILNWIEFLLKVTDWSINHYNHATVEELLALNATTGLGNKVDKMQKVFGFSKKIQRYINFRIKQFKHENLIIPYKVGKLPKRRKK